jgi:hypothetical protein
VLLVGLPFTLTIITSLARLPPRHIFVNVSALFRLSILHASWRCFCGLHPHIPGKVITIMMVSV